MKILITGMNKNAVTFDFYLRQQLKVVPSHYSLIRCLKDMGHTVDQRLVQIGESLKEYDEVIVFLASPRQQLQLAFYNGLWAIAQKPDCILAFDDWQTDGIFKGITSCTDEESLLKDFTIGQNRMCDPSLTREKLLPHAETLLGAIQKIQSRTNRMLISAFDGGDLSKLLAYPTELLYRYNPNPYHLNRGPGHYDDSDTIVKLDSLVPGYMLTDPETVKPEDKERKFNFASLVQTKTLKWLKKQSIASWPVQYFGSRAQKQDRLTEGEMCKVFARQWGCLMPGYPHTTTSDWRSSGWWRARPLQVADAGSILIGEPSEMFVYYRDKALASLKASDIETLSMPELKTIARAQQIMLYKNHPLNKSVEKAELDAVLKGKK